MRIKLHSKRACLPHYRNYSEYNISKLWHYSLMAKSTLYNDKSQQKQMYFDF